MPVRPSTWRSAPSQPIRPARVTTNDGMPKRVNQLPWNTPTSVPVKTPASTASGAGTFMFTDSTAITAAHSPLTMPTERSISPSSRTSTTPTEMVPTAAIWIDRFTRLNESRKMPFEAYWKMAQMATRPITTGSWPTSPSRTRRR